MTGGNNFPFYVKISVGCSSSVVISPPAPLFTDPIIFDQDTGEHEVTIGIFTTSDGLCPVKSY
jgi:hypothetical protein